MAFGDKMRHLRRKLIAEISYSAEFHRASPLNHGAIHLHSTILSHRCFYYVGILRSVDSVLLEKVGSAPTTRGGAQTRSNRKKSISPEKQLLQRVNALVGQRDAAEAVRVMKSALHGDWPPIFKGQDREQPSLSTPAGGLPIALHAKQRPVFSSKAFAASLYACEAAGNAEAGLSLVNEVRRHAGSISSDWLQSENILFAVLRLQCAAGDRDGATHMFAYLEQHGLLRLRSASVFLRYSCTQLSDRRLAFAVYEKAIQHKIELMEADYLALGRLCVRVREPISTLFFMLEEMKEHLSVLCPGFVYDVIKPWIVQANHSAGSVNKSHPRYHIEIVEQMELHESATLKGMDAAATDKAGTSPSESRGDDSRTETNGSSNIRASVRALTQTRGVCPVCHTELSGYPFTTACRAHLLRELKDLVVPQACRSHRARLGFEHWRRYIHARHDRGDHVDVFIDGANLGYYGLSSWYDLAKKALLMHRSVPEAQITAKDIDFNTQRKASGKSVDVGVNFDLIDRAVRLAVETYGLKRPLVLLHERHVEPRFMTPQSTAIVQRWRSHGWLYCSPTGLNDDLCWLYGALLMTDPTDMVVGNFANTSDGHTSSAEHAAAAAATSRRTFVCTNDKMRDHHFRLLSPRAFTRWRDRHRIGFRCVRVEDLTELYWNLPAPFEQCIQRHDAVLHAGYISQASTISNERTPHGEKKRSTTVSTWHIPFWNYSPGQECDSSVSSLQKAVAVRLAAGIDTDDSQPQEARGDVEDSSAADANSSSLQDNGGEGNASREPNETLRSLSWACVRVEI